MVSKEGPWSLYKGIKASWISEGVNDGCMLGLYAPIKILLGVTAGSQNMVLKFLAGGCAGAIGAMIGCPLVLIKTRMMADKGSNTSYRKAIKDIYAEKGLIGFYQGFSAMFIRAIVLSGTQNAIYETVKNFVAHRFMLQGIPLQFLAAIAAGFVLMCTVSPFDRLRTKMMAPKDESTQKDMSLI
jgi:hypothetical protein